MRYEIEDNTREKLEAIRLIAPEMAKELASKAGFEVQRAMQTHMRQSKHHWFAKPSKGGIRTPYKDMSKTKELGRRTNRDATNATNPESMANFITNYFDEKNSLVVVGGTHRTFTPQIRKNGKIIGTGKSVKGVGKHSASILHKLDTGERNEHHGWWNGSSIGSESMIEGAIFRGRGFKRQGINDTRGYVNRMITSEYDKRVMQSIQGANIRTRSVS